MIRRRLHERWRRRQRVPLLAAFREPVRWQWLDRFNAWHVRTWGEKPNPGEAWWSRIAAKFVLWLCDWRTTLCQRRPWRAGEWEELRPRYEEMDRREGATS